MKIFNFLDFSPELSTASNQLPRTENYESLPAPSTSMRHQHSDDTSYDHQSIYDEDDKVSRAHEYHRLHHEIQLLSSPLNRLFHQNRSCYHRKGGKTKGSESDGSLEIKVPAVSEQLKNFRRQNNTFSELNELNLPPPFSIEQPLNHRIVQQPPAARNQNQVGEQFIDWPLGFFTILN